MPGRRKRFQKNCQEADKTDWRDFPLFIRVTSYNLCSRRCLSLERTGWGSAVANVRGLAGRLAIIESSRVIPLATINPRNILFDEQDRLRWIDFDHTLKIGDGVEVGFEPYVRHHRVDYGIAGPVTEQFALGSIFWFMTRRTEVYADIDGAERANRLSRRIFAEVDSKDPIDAIISDCWQGKFESIAALARRIRQAALDKRLEEKSRICEQHYVCLRAALDCGPNTAAGGSGGTSLGKVE